MNPHRFLKSKLAKQQLRSRHLQSKQRGSSRFRFRLIGRSGSRVASYRSTDLVNRARNPAAHLIIQHSPALNDTRRHSETIALNPQVLGAYNDKPLASQRFERRQGFLDFAQVGPVFTRR